MVNKTLIKTCGDEILAAEIEKGFQDGWGQTQMPYSFRINLDDLDDPREHYDPAGYMHGFGGNMNYNE